jgi:hypothetical protein
MDGSSRPRAPQPAPPERGFSFTDWQVSNPTAPPPGDKLDAELDRTNQAVEDVIGWVSTSLNSDGSLVEPPVGEPPPDTGGAAAAFDYAEVSQAWAEHMPDTIPPNILAVMGVTGDHWSARWWANQAAQALSMLGRGAIIGAAPPALVAGVLWFDTVSLTLFIAYDDGNSVQWVPANPGTSGAAFASAGGPWINDQNANGYDLLNAGTLNAAAVAAAVVTVTASLTAPTASLGTLQVANLVPTGNVSFGGHNLTAVGTLTASVVNAGTIPSFTSTTGTITNATLGTVTLTGNVNAGGHNITNLSTLATAGFTATNAVISTLEVGTLIGGGGSPGGLWLADQDAAGHNLTGVGTLAASNLVATSAYLTTLEVSTLVSAGDINVGFHNIINVSTLAATNLVATSANITLLQPGSLILTGNMDCGGHNITNTGTLAMAALAASTGIVSGDFEILGNLYLHGSTIPVLADSAPGALKAMLDAGTIEVAQALRLLLSRAAAAEA